MDIDACVCCRKSSKYSVLLAIDDVRPLRYYLPNQLVREDPADMIEVPFCHKCMRAIEDNLRATIMYLSSEAKPMMSAKTKAALAKQVRENLATPEFKAKVKAALDAVLADKGE